MFKDNHKLKFMHIWAEARKTTWGQTKLIISPVCLRLSPAPRRRLAVRGGSVQDGAVCAESVSWDHSAEPVCFEYWQVNGRLTTANNPSFEIIFYFFTF